MGLEEENNIDNNNQTLLSTETEKSPLLSRLNSRPSATAISFGTIGPYFSMILALKRLRLVISNNNESAND